ncbi:MAG TPA: hypothetical protein VHV30_13310 [Polyangiaceae bacterium]|jgi:hypothetical protein|nr:hypothetical protein [Polyangiaceae bacterium]
MAAPGRPRTSRATILRGSFLLVALVGGGCATDSCGGGQDNGALGAAGFSFDCAGDSADPDRPTLDAWCATTQDTSTIPDVVAGAPFQLNVSTGDRPQPALASLAASSADGWAIAQPGWLGFLVFSGSDVLDFTHVHAQAVASLVWQAPPASTLVAGTPPATLAVVPQGADGGTLGGELPCTFGASDPAIIGVTSRGRIATVTANGTGDATITAACAGLELAASIHVTGASTSDAEPGDDSPSFAEEGGADDPAQDAGDADDALDAASGDGADAAEGGP